MKDIYALCECGSGKKVKWCCMAKDKELPTPALATPAKEPRKPNRSERRRVTVITTKMNRENKKKSALRSKHYLALQEWMSIASTSLTKEEVDEVFKRTVKKLFKKDYKTDSEFQAAIKASIRSLETLPIQAQEETVNDQGV